MCLDVLDGGHAHPGFAQRLRGTRTAWAALGLFAVVLVAGGARAAEPAHQLQPQPAPPLRPEAVCPGSEDGASPATEQKRALRCLINDARRRGGRTPLRSSPVLASSASLKAQDIHRCRELAHAACGKDPRAGLSGAGYPNVTWAENLYAIVGGDGSALSALIAWLRSPSHRQTLFDPRWTEQGVALLRSEDDGGSAIWVAHFGERR
jgi:uncharacterized protein YkwD